MTVPRAKDLFGVDLPIIQAPMAGVQGSALAIAVSESGGLGSLPAAMLDSDGLRREVAAIRSGSKKPFNVNFFCHDKPVQDAERETRWLAALEPYYAELGIEADSTGQGPVRSGFDYDAAALIAEVRPPVVSFHFGLPPADLLEQVRDTGAKIMSSATTVDEAVWLESRGVDAVIAQGVEAGGHRGMFLTDDLNTQTGTFALVPQILNAVKTPVIAAGGIADARGVAAAFALGATAVQVGTAYLLCPETTTTEVHRAALKSDRARITALTNVFSGRPARSIVNRIVRDLGPISDLPPAFPLATSALHPLRARSERDSSDDFSPIWSGQNVTGCAEIPAGDLTLRLAEDL